MSNSDWDTSELVLTADEVTDVMIAYDQAMHAATSDTSKYHTTGYFARINAIGRAWHGFVRMQEAVEAIEKGQQ